MLFQTLWAGLHSASFTTLRCNRASSTSIQSLTLWICGCTGLRKSRLSLSPNVQSSPDACPHSRLVDFTMAIHIASAPTGSWPHPLSLQIHDLPSQDGTASGRQPSPVISTTTIR